MYTCVYVCVYQNSGMWFSDQPMEDERFIFLIICCRCGLPTQTARWNTVHVCVLIHELLSSGSDIFTQMISGLWTLNCWHPPPHIYTEAHKQKCSQGHKLFGAASKEETVNEENMGEDCVCLCLYTLYGVCLRKGMRKWQLQHWAHDIFCLHTLCPLLLLLSVKSSVIPYWRILDWTPD